MATPRTVTARVMAILGAFSRERPEMGLQEISRQTGLAVSTTHRLVTELAQWGALTRIDESTYRIGPLIRRLAATTSADEKSRTHSDIPELEHSSSFY
jgi:DNA-binding IclR family transcriptional regulator